MANTAGRPRTPKGTTDWELVFEDEKTGFIPLIAQAHSPGALKECATLVILKLFSRKGDLPEVEHFATELAAIIPDEPGEEDMAAMRDGVSALLREIKDERIRIAADYLAGKKKGKERRVSRPKRKRRKPAGGFVFPPWAWPAALAAVGAGIVAIIIAAALRETLPPSSRLVEQMEAAARGDEVPPAHVYGGALKIGEGGAVTAEGGAVTAEGVPHKPCVNTAWALAHTGRVVINGAMPPRITAGLLAELCARNRGEGGVATLTWIP